MRLFSKLSNNKNNYCSIGKPQYEMSGIILNAELFSLSHNIQGVQKRRRKNK